MHDRHALQLGRLCISWSILDSYLDKIIAALIPASPDRVSAITTSASDTSQRCEMIKRLIVIENPGAAWRDWLIALINRVAAELSPTRNRYIHDNWHIKDLKLIRTDRRGKVGRPQAREDVQFTYDIEHVTDPSDVEKLISKTNLVWAMLAFAEYDLRHWRRKGQPLEPLPQHIPASKPSARYQTPREVEEARRQGLPTSGLVFD
jgi:hypothetical protein